MRYFFIYGLFDPRQPIELDYCRYVGQTIQTLPERLKGHVFSGKNGSATGTRSHCNNWVLSLLNAGVRPVIKPIEVVTDENLLDQLETFWIAEGKRLGWRLVNDPTQLGGSNVDGKLLAERWLEWYANNPKAVQAMRDKQQEWWDDPAHREEASQRRKDHWADPWKREKHTAAFNRPENRELRSAIMRQRWEDPVLREEMMTNVLVGLANEDKSPTPCDECDFIATGPRGLGIHIGQMHSGKIEVYCDCGAGPFDAKRHLTQHITKFHIVDKSNLFCECGEGPFKGTAGLAIHQSTHFGFDEPRMCDCGSGPYVDLRSLNTHIGRSPLHQDVPGLFCDICETGPFKGKQGLGLHKRHKHSEVLAN